MNRTITMWLLTGALVASLGWNARVFGERERVRANPQPPYAGSPDLEKLRLSLEQKTALQPWCASSCKEGCSLANEAEAKLAELHAALRDPATTPEALRDLAAETNRLRALSLEACVDSIIAVRRVLTKEQLEALLQCCGTTATRDPRPMTSLGYSNEK